MSRPRLVLVAILAAGALRRRWRLDTLEFNSDDAVCARPAAAFAGDPVLSENFLDLPPAWGLPRNPESPHGRTLPFGVVRLTRSGGKVPRSRC